MWTDEIVEEIHRIREEYAKFFNDDLDAIFEDLRKKQAESGREVVNLSRQSDRPTRWSRLMPEQGQNNEDVTSSV
jgi:hypothetical protein